VAVRYAAVAPAGDEIVIAGGSVGIRASRAVYAFDPAKGSVRKVANLPRGLTHSTGVAVGGTVYLLGGRGANLGSQTRRVVAIDPRTGAVRRAGALPHALSDAGAAAVARNSIVLAGGVDSGGTVRSEVFTLEPR
jgi:N-acetylneuraminic acid mutarotase